jgi:hypothetical protein
MAKHYTSHKKRFTIHRPSTFRSVIFQGQIVQEKILVPPVEFIDKRFTTSDAEVIAFLAKHPAYGKDFIALEDVEAQVEDAGLTPAAKLEKITGVTNKNAAVQALVERGVDPGEFDATTNKTAIKEIARSKGFEFVGW